MGLKGFDPGGSVKKLKSGLKKSSGAFIKGVPSEGITVRIIEEPDKWCRYLEHFNQEHQYSVPCSDDCQEDHSAGARKPSKKVLVNAVDVTEGREIPLKLPVTVARQLLKFYDKYGTIMDRDYEITREGSGIDTQYNAAPESKTRMNIDRFKLFDLEEVLMDSLRQAQGIEVEDDEAENDDDDDDDLGDGAMREMRRPAKKGPTKRLPAKKTLPAKKVPKKSVPAKKVPPRKSVPAKKSVPARRKSI